MNSAQACTTLAAVVGLQAWAHSASAWPVAKNVCNPRGISTKPISLMSLSHHHSSLAQVNGTKAVHFFLNSTPIISV